MNSICILSILFRWSRLLCVVKGPYCLWPALPDHWCSPVRVKPGHLQTFPGIPRESQESQQQTFFFICYLTMIPRSQKYLMDTPWIPFLTPYSTHITKDSTMLCRG